MAVVTELVSQFSFKGDLKPQENFNANLKQSVALLSAVAVGFYGATGVLFAFVAEATSAADALLDMNAETGISVESIQELGFAAALSGSSTEAMTASLAGLAKVSGDAARGLGKGKKAFDELGISVKDSSGNVKTADILFGELRDSFARLGTDQATQKSIIAALGLDPSTLQLLNATSEEVAVLVEKSRALGIVTTEQAQAAAEFQDSLDTAKFAVSAISQQIAIGLAPTMQRITDGFVEFLIANKDLIQDGLKYLGETLVAVSGFLNRMAPILGVLAAAFGIAQLAAGGFAKIMGIILSPVVLITVAIVALLLIIDDLMVALDGGESVIADFFMEFFGWDIVPVLRGIVDAFKAMFAQLLALAQPFIDAFSQIFTAIIAAFNGNWAIALQSLLDAFNSVGTGIKNIFMGLFDFIGTAFGQILAGIKSAATSILPDWAIELVSSGGSPEALGAPQGAEGIAAPLPSGSGQDPWDVPGMSPNDAVAMTPAGNTSVNNSQIKQEIKIDIASSDPKQAGAAVDSALQDQLKTAKTQVNRGGR